MGDLEVEVVTIPPIPTLAKIHTEAKDLAYSDSPR